MTKSLAFTPRALLNILNGVSPHRKPDNHLFHGDLPRGLLDHPDTWDMTGGTDPEAVDINLVFTPVIPGTRLVPVASDIPLLLIGARKPARGNARCLEACTNIYIPTPFELSSPEADGDSQVLPATASGYQDA